MKRNCLVHVFAAHNMLPAAAAIKFYGIQKHPTEEAEVTVLLHMPGWEQIKLDQITDLVNRQARSQGWGRVIVLTQSEMQQVTGPAPDLSDPNTLDRFRKVIGKSANEITEVYYSHDVVGFPAQLCMRSFPNAKRITYGESMGLMEDKDYVIASVTGAGWDESKVHLRPKKNEPKASTAVLIMPADQTGDCLKDIELMIVPRELALGVISDFQSEITELVSYSQTLLQHTKSPRFLFVVNNLADANFISAEKEACMYEEMIRAHVPAGASVIVKGHPLATHPIDQMLVDRLSNDYVASAISSDFSRYPMEIWKDLLENCQLISLSYCSISIEYLYRKPVIYSINHEIILKYMEEKVWNRFRDGDEFFRQQREALKTWDGKGVLCSGKRISFPAVAPKPPELKQDLAAAEKLNQEGISLFQSGKIEDALRVFLEGFSLAPNHTGIANNLGATCWQLAKPYESALYFSLAQSSNPDDRAVVLNLFQVLTHLGHKEAAKSVCFIFLRRHPEDREIFDLYNRS